MKFLADVNVIFPLLVSRHAHREKALDWFESTGTGDVALSRLTRLGVLPEMLKSKILVALKREQAVRRFEDGPSVRSNLPACTSSRGRRIGAVRYA